MNILQVTPYFAPAWAYGGPPRSIYELSKELVRNGHSVTVMTTDVHDPRRRHTLPAETMDGIRVLRFPNISNDLAWRHQLYLPIGTGRYLHRNLSRFDVIHLHMFRTFQNLVVHRYALEFGIPYVFSARGSILRIVRRRVVKTIFDVAYGRSVLDDAVRLVALSRAEKKQYEQMGVPPSKISVVFNGIDLQSFRRTPPEGAFARQYGLEGRQLVTYLGRLNARKGLECLLHAFRAIRDSHQNVTLILAGPDEGLEARFRKLAKMLDISDSVVFTGLVTGEDRLKILIGSDVVVYPGYQEVFGLVPFEALACGKPVVVSDDSGCGEIVREAQAGLTVPVGDIAGWRDAIITALENGTEIQDMVCRGSDFVRSKLNWRTIAVEMEAVYRDAVERASRDQDT